MKKNKFKRVLSIALAAVMVAGTFVFTPQGASKVQAATTPTVKDVNLGTAGIGNPTSTDSSASAWAGSKVYYGNKLWRVLDASHDSNGTEGAAFLFSDESQGKKQYHARQEAITWEKCTLRTYLNGSGNAGGSGTFLGDTFTAKEQSEINTTTVQNPDNPKGIEGGAVTQDKLFLLSFEEVQKASYGFGSDSTREVKGKDNWWWWLRSPGERANCAAVVNFSGAVSLGGSAAVGIGYNTGLCLPAFNLNLDSVLFSAASSAGKSSFASVGDGYVSDNIWKLTLKDSDTSFAATLPTAGIIGSDVSVEVTTAGSGSVTYNQTSAMLVDSNNTVVAYGSIGDANSGTKTFAIPSTVTAGTYTLKVFPEQVNGGNLTDYAGQVVSSTITIAAPTYDVTITNPADSHITLSAAAGNGAEIQNGLTGAMTPVVYTAAEGYYFPTAYAVTGSNGVSVTRDSYTQITVAGTPTATANVTLIAATEKASQSAPSVTDGVDKIAGTTTAMEYASSESATTWTPCSDTSTAVAAGTWYVRYAATDTLRAGTAAKVVVTATPPAPSTYTVTVNNGTGSGEYAEGATVTITADAAPNGQEFDKWTVESGGVTLAGATSTTTTFEMPANAVEVTATYKNITPPAPSTYTVTVNNGTGSGEYAEGATVTITADAAPNGQEFDKWTVESGGVTLAGATSTTTTFEMPANAVEVTATYKNITPPAPSTYTVTVNNGTGSGEYAEGETVTIRANVTDGKAEDSNNTEDTVSGNVPQRMSVMLTATGSTEEGNADATAVDEGTDQTTAGREFQEWQVVKGNIVLADSKSAETTFIMPAEDVEITAVFKDGTDDNKPDDGDKDDNKPGNGGDSNGGQDSGHDHNYEWKVVNEATAGQDGEEIYYCTICGNITARQSVSSFGVYNKDVLAKITTAAQGAIVEIDTDTWMSYPAYILKELEQHPDVTLVTKFRYKGKKYSFTIPARAGEGKASTSGKATGTNQLTEEGVNWYGYLYLGGKYGLTEITDK